MSKFKEIKMKEDETFDEFYDHLNDIVVGIMFIIWTIG